MGFSKFIVFTLLITTLFALVQSHNDCSFDYSSYYGPQKKLNVILKDKKSAESHFKWLSRCCDKSVQHISKADCSKDIGEDTIRDFSVKDTFFGYTAYFNPNFVEQYLEKMMTLHLLARTAKYQFKVFVLPSKL